MIGYRKRSFFLAHKLLTNLRMDQDDLKSLRELQVLLAHEIVRTERGVRKLKAELKGSSVDDKRQTYLRKKIESYRYCAYVWRSFGDAIAFVYLDKFALKHTYYQTGKKSPKSDAGFLSDKDGLEHELRLLFTALDHNVPAILTDLTNTIRHGDVCLMGASDPFLMEVKATPSRNERARRQKDSLDILHNFFETDGSTRLWGNPDLRREALTDLEVAYIQQLNECISSSLAAGFGAANPESGLQYYALRSDKSLPEAVATFGNARAPWVFVWNDPFGRRNWMPYLPPVLSIANSDHLWAFVRGEIVIMIVVDMITLEEIVAELGFEGRFDTEEASHPLSIKFGNDGGGMWISEDMLGRIGMECASPRWITKNGIETFVRATSETSKVLDGDLASNGLRMMDEKSRLELVRMGMPEDMQVVIKMDAILDEARGHPGKYQ
ncbi:hypothetical protein FHX10_002567 [Rhizobium sp. BK591]|uniref:hypothetical protein n=1 Tax=Rhizobium sp. BK591 TaxID=2586985 RepID=UPI00161FDF11|nr:hypothetical protein [Rhizobium sp. BK591]MBB3743074.1 hypothetical protein [Rhizobium sp. BK591]